MCQCGGPINQIRPLESSACCFAALLWSGLAQLRREKFCTWRSLKSEITLAARLLPLKEK
jgi:hypothetical protein